MNKIFDIALKDMTRSFRSVFAIGMMVVAPLLITGLFYFAFGGMVGGDSDMPPVTVGVVNLDNPANDSPVRIGDMIAEMYSDPSVQGWLTNRTYPDEASAREAVQQQEVSAAAIIPVGFTEALLAGETGITVKIIQDPLATSGPMVVRSMLESFLEGISGGGISYQVIRDRYAAVGVTLSAEDMGLILQRYQDWYAGFQRNLFHNPEDAALRLTSSGEAVATEDPVLKILASVIVGQMIFFSFYTGAYSMLSLLREDEEGTLQRLFTTPTNRTSILAGKLLAVFLTVIIQGIVLLSIGKWAFAVDWGKAASVGLSTFGQVAAASGLGVLLISLVKTTKQAGPVLGGGLTALGMLSGLFTSNIPNMPEAFTAIANFTPQGWVMKAWTLTLNGADAASVLMPFMVSVLLGIAMFAVGAVIFRRRYA